MRTYNVRYVDNYGEHNIEVMTGDEHEAAHAEEMARNYLCRPLKYVEARREAPIPTDDLSCADIVAFLRGFLRGFRRGICFLA